jgi:hypothetical protein
LDYFGTLAHQVQGLAAKFIKTQLWQAVSGNGRAIDDL